MHYAISLETGQKVFGRLAYKYINEGGKSHIRDVIQVRTEHGFDEVFIDSSTIGFDDLDADNAARQRKGEPLRGEPDAV